MVLLVVVLIAIALTGYLRVSPSGRTFFTGATGLEWLPSAVVDGVYDHSTGAFGSGSVRTVHVKASPSDVKLWFESRPFHDRAQWKTGPLELSPLFLDSMPTDITDSEEVRYALDRSGEQGKLLVVNPITGDAWLQQWW